MAELAKRPALFFAQGIFLLSVVVAAPAGCAGHAEVTLIAMSTRRLSLDGPLQFDFRPRKCYWWANDDGDICIAMDYHNLSLAGNYTRDSLELSFVLGSPPADQARTFRAKPETLRAIWHRGPFHLRLNSRRGIVAVHTEKNEVLSGRFRLLCSSEKFEVLTGWRKQSQILLQGDFTAINDPARGRQILQITEEALPRRESEPKHITFEPG